MHAVEEIAPPTVGLHLLFVLGVVVQERLLFVRIGLEEEAADLLEGTAQTLEEFTHTTFGKPSPEGLLVPIAHLCRRPEAAGGNLAFEVVELGRFQSARVTLVVEVTEG